MAWQSRPIFVSSTFSDMQAERDHLRTHVFPALEERLQAKRGHLEWVDLRLGVATAGESLAEARELQTLKVCLTEVRRCQPFLIVLLGDRYGWVPPIERVAAAAAEEGYVADIAGWSVTELEIRYGVFADSDQQPRSYFYFREPLPYENMPCEVAALYSDLGDTDPNATDRAERLSRLKREVEHAHPQRVRRYQVEWDSAEQKVVGLEAWGQKVLEDIWYELEADKASGKTEELLSWQEIERIALDDYIENRARGFVGRDEFLARTEELAGSEVKDGAPWALCLTGAAGAGKSAVFGQLFRRLKGSNIFVLGHAIDASTRSPSVEDMLRRWCEELAEGLGIDSGIAENANREAIDRAFQLLLARMAAQRRVVILVDALDQFEATARTQFLTGLSRARPKNARLIATLRSHHSPPGFKIPAWIEKTREMFMSVRGDSSDMLSGLVGAEYFELPPLDADEASRLVKGICDRYHRTLEPEVVAALLGKRDAKGQPAWANTLWLVLAVEEINLVDADDFAHAKHYDGNSAEQVRALMLDVVAALPTTIPELYKAIFERVEKWFGSAQAQSFIGLISVSRAGWRETDFRGILPRYSRDPWDELRFASLRRAFRGQLRRRGQFGQWDFNHSQMRVAARQYLVDNNIGETALHAAAAEHLLSLPLGEPLRTSETMVHLLGSANFSRAAAYYGGDLTEDELARSTNVLAESIINPPEGRTRTGIDDVRALLSAAGTAKEVVILAATRLLWNLDDMLSGRVALSVRATLCEDLHQVIAALAQSDPENLELQRELGRSYLQKGDILAAAGDLTGALALYDAYRTGMTRLKQTLDPGEQQNLSVSYSRIGNVLLAQGNLSGALAAYQSDAAVMENLVRVDPQNLSLQRSLSVSYHKIGQALTALGRHDEALAAYKKDLNIAARMLEHDPKNGNLQRDLGISHLTIGDLLFKQKKFVDAQTSYEVYQAISESLVHFNPGNMALRRDLALAREKIGDVMVAQGNPEAALAHYMFANQNFFDISCADDNNLEWKRDVAVSHQRLGDAFLTLKSYSNAIIGFKTAIDFFVFAWHRSIKSAGLQDDVKRAFSGIGRTLNAIEPESKAVVCFTSAFEILQRLTPASPVDARQHSTFVAVYQILGSAFADLGTGENSSAVDGLRSGHEVLQDLLRTSQDDNLKRALSTFAKQIDALAG